VAGLAGLCAASALRSRRRGAPSANQGVTGLCAVSGELADPLLGQEAPELQRPDAATRAAQQLQRRSRARALKERNNKLANPAVPSDVRGYVPGEGYGSNALPFLGISPKTGKRIKESHKQQALVMIKQAKIISVRLEEELASREAALPSRLLPVPEDRFLELRDLGWLDALGEQGIKVSFEEEVEESQGLRWVHLMLEGNEDDIQAGALQLMALLAPPRLLGGAPEPRGLLASSSR